ncbi:MAG: TlpA disulfide reductase family protein [Gammaproteobacteria bacterium]|nr:TlpA disulfide reductase family protein [Gammaproteobacteria bacterium]MDE0450157.1 TlpA disulfide reductase family protein [Gammaproteobacteria bacterium]
MHFRRRHLGCIALLVLAACADVPFRLADGSTAVLSPGKYVAINYWAEWCVPCRQEIPELNALHHEQEATGLLILGVNYDGISGESLVALIEEMGIEFPVLVSDPFQRFGYDLPDVLPTTVIIGPDHKVHEILVGPQTQESLLHAAPESARIRTRA